MPDEVEKIKTTTEATVEPSAGGGAGDVAETKVTPPAEVSATETQAETKSESQTGVLASNEPPKEDWREARIRVLTAKLAEERTKSATLKSQVDQDPGARDASIREEARQLAEQQVAIEKFNSACASAASSGREKFGKEAFDKSLASILEVAGASNGQWLDNESAQRYNQFLAVAFEAGDASRLIHDLGNDKQEFARILGLPPVKQAAELAKRVVRAEAKGVEEPSRLPKPITPVGSRGNANSKLDPASPEDASKMSTADWMAAREAQAKASYVDMRRGVR